MAEPGSRRTPPTEIIFQTNGPVPFPQVILRGVWQEHIFKGEQLQEEPAQGAECLWTYTLALPAGTLGPGMWQVQVEGCRKADWQQSGGGDWVKAFAELEVKMPALKPKAKVLSGAAQGLKIYFGIHKHMHQPYYRAADPGYWDGEKDSIFGSRSGPYTHFIPTAVGHYAAGELPHAGLSTSWSGSLIEQLDACEMLSHCGGVFNGWKEQLREAAKARTKLGHPRCDFTAFGFYHPLMALIPHRNIVKHLRQHAAIIQRAFQAKVSPVLFPPETAFHVRMIPALVEAGVEAVIYDSIHRFRACEGYPYAGPNEGMLPPNRAEQVNPPVDDWLQLHNIWAGSKISPQLLRPEWVVYTDPDGQEHRIIGVPAERYIGNEDARGGYGALQYENVFGQLYDHLCATDSFDPKHPPFFLLHSDGDNHGGGADSYYHHNTQRLVQWLQQDPRFELSTVRDYLVRFPPNPEAAVHLEPGSWAGADNGDPQFKKWFSRYDEPYSPDLNSWAVLTALQNTVHALEDQQPDHPEFARIERLMLTAETSCYWYWTGQHVWDEQVTHAANAAWGCLGETFDKLAREDTTAPTIFPPWAYPENPGGQMWGQGGLVQAPRQAKVHTFVYDIAGLKEVTLTLRHQGGEDTLKPVEQAPYPSQTGPARTADFVTFALPEGLGDCRYFIRAIDTRGNTARSSLERLWLA